VAQQGHGGDVEQVRQVGIAAGHIARGGGGQRRGLRGAS
jgi:hypothetical protein